MTRDQYGMLTVADATRVLGAMNRNEVRAAATEAWGAAGADFDGERVSLMSGGVWRELHADMNRGLERWIFRGGC